MMRRHQISRVDLVSHLHRGNVFFDRFMAGLQQSAVLTGGTAADSSRHALAQLEQMVDPQAIVLAFVSAFSVLGVIVAFLVPLPFFKKRPSPEDMAAYLGAN